MYLDFESANNNSVVEDKSGNKNDAVLLKGAKISGRKLGKYYANYSHFLSNTFFCF